MSAKVRLFDTETGEYARVSSEGFLRVQEAMAPPAIITNTPLVYRQFLRNSAGSSDMRVNGSVTPVEFSIVPPATADLYITQLVFTIADQSMTLSKFANLTALTNGLSVTYGQDRGPVVIADSLKTNFEVARLCITSRVIDNDFIVPNIVGAVEGMVVNLDFKQVFGFKWGLLLRHETNQSLTVTVRDDLSVGIDQFDCLAYGFSRDVG